MATPTRPLSAAKAGAEKAMPATMAVAVKYRNIFMLYSSLRAGSLRAADLLCFGWLPAIQRHPKAARTRRSPAALDHASKADLFSACQSRPGPDRCLQSGTGYSLLSDCRAQACRLRNPLIFDSRLKNGAGFHLSDDTALDFLPRRLMLRIVIAAIGSQRRPARRKLFIGNQNVCRAAAKIDANPVAGLRSASPPPAAASGEALRMDGLPDVPDWRPSPIQASEEMPFFRR